MRYSPTAFVLLTATTLALAGCGQKPQTASEAKTPVSPSASPASPSSAPANPSSQVEPPKGPQETEEDAIRAVYKAIRSAHLTDLADQCLAYHFAPNKSGKAYRVDVLENHRHSECGGDPQVQPRLFTVEIDKETHKLSTDKGTPGTFHPIPDN